jgi:MoxR-like ATPase
MSGSAITDGAAALGDDDLQQLARVAATTRQLEQELAKVIVGQHDTITQVLTAMVAGGHCLLIGVPGLAKTLLVHSLAETLKLQFSRIQFTPDLMPSDITGTEVIQEDRASGTRAFRFLPGPVFANVVLADEINRTPPKTQAALLEAMQEGQVTVGGQKHSLPRPFFVLATQNPIEQEGTYPLPEAQLDRFMFSIRMDYPAEDEELAIVLRTTADRHDRVTPQLGADELLNLARVVRRVPIAEPVARYALQLARMTRPQAAGIPDFIKQYVTWGAGPRASQYLVLGAKARAALDGRSLVETRDINAVAAPVLRHRIRVNFAAEADGVSVDQIVAQLIERLRERARKGDDERAVAQVFRSADAG